MRKKIKQQRLQVWVDQTEMQFLQDYSGQNHMTVSELIRGWIHEAMKREGYNIKEPSLPSLKKTG